MQKDSFCFAHFISNFITICHAYWAQTAVVTCADKRWLSVNTVESVYSDYRVPITAYRDSFANVKRRYLVVLRKADTHTQSDTHIHDGHLPGEPKPVTPQFSRLR